MPPSGRATYPTAYVPNASRVPVSAVAAREEQVTEDERGGGAVDGEVVPLQRGAGQARGEGLVPGCGARRWRLGPTDIGGTSLGLGCCSILVVYGEFPHQRS